MSFIATKWAIRHKPTGRFMPQSSKKKHGYTHDDPVECGDHSHWCPRLFGREQDAKTALAWWLKGAISASWVDNRAWDSMYPEPDLEWYTDPVVERKAEDMEVVPMTLEVKS